MVKIQSGVTLPILAYLGDQKKEKHNSYLSHTSMMRLRSVISAVAWEKQEDRNNKKIF